MLKAGSFIVIPSFAVTELCLKGNELLMFSIVWGFSQDGESWFTGTRAYLAEWCGCSKVTVTKALSSLCERGFLEKRVRTESGVTLCDYAVAKKLYPQVKNFTTPVKNLNGGSKDSCPPPVKNLNPDTIGGNHRDSITKRESASAARFAPPTPEDVSAYAAGKGYASFDAARFVSYYESNGWRVGRNPMKSWRAAVDNWARRDAQASAPREAVSEYAGDF